MLLQITFLAAIIPSILLIRYVSGSDKYPEPSEMLWKTFIAGFLIVFPVLLVVLPIDYLIQESSLIHSPLALSFSMAFLTAALPEEFFKFMILSKFCARSKHFDEPMDGIVYAAVASLGFATFENILYVLNGGLTLAVARGLTAVPAHASFGIIMGSFYAHAHFSGKKPSLLSPAYIIPVILHGFYNFFIFYPTNLVSQYSEFEDIPFLEGSFFFLSIIGFLFVFGFTLRKAYHLLQEMILEQEEL
jgi:RsiW-degrading membrane proteinase PrsW (M82 family)